MNQIVPQNDFSVKVKLFDGPIGQTPNTEEIVAKSVIVCAGPWTSKLMNPLG